MDCKPTLPRLSPTVTLQPTTLSDSVMLDVIPCDCSDYCDSECGHAVDIDEVGPIYLCNRDCKCTAECSNRLKASTLLFDIEWDVRKGWCLLSKNFIPANIYIGDYTGTIINSPNNDNTSTRNYTLTIRESSTTGTLITHIDATTRGTDLRFMNHSCKPNVKIIPMRDDNVYPRATCWTCADVLAGEELCISYGETPGKVKCYCGESSCRGFLPLEQFT